MAGRGFSDDRPTVVVSTHKGAPECGVGRRV